MATQFDRAAEASRARRRARSSSSARRRSAPCSNGMISTSTACSRRSSPRSSSRASTRPPASSSRSPPSPRASRCGRSARWCSGGSATWSGARTPSWSPWASWACRPSSSACCRAMRRSASRRRSLLVVLRLLQGLALGGEYGGAATYVAEHAPDGQARALHQLHPDHRDARACSPRCSWSSASARRSARRRSPTGAGGIPFLISIVLLGVSLWIRLQLDESPVFQRDEGGGRRRRRRR